ncbi:hypothetical protein K438DRAFT_1985278 [Mycena galopus ATCC 62051]|nr:hypothetical protein K438DRAFT_1985278 [Mycena galopus ATCC 62051]
MDLPLSTIHRRTYIFSLLILVGLCVGAPRTNNDAGLTSSVSVVANTGIPTTSSVSQTPTNSISPGAVIGLAIMSVCLVGSAFILIWRRQQRQLNAKQAPASNILPSSTTRSPFNLIRTDPVDHVLAKVSILAPPGLGTKENIALGDLKKDSDS